MVDARGHDSIPLVIDERLLESRYEVRADLRYLGGPKKIEGIKLVRELVPGLGLGEAKDLVEQQGWVLEDVPIAEAKLAERQFVELGAHVELVPRSLTIMAFDPQHHARGSQPLVRMSVTGNLLTIERGRLDAWPAPDLAAARAFDQPDELRAAIEVQQQAWQAAGLQLERDPIALLGHVSAREPTLEQAIRSADPPDEPLLVYADWLAARGDPRGELGPLQHVGATQEFDAALVRHATHLFGPLMPALEQLQIELDWQLGMVRRVVVPISDRVVQGGNLEALTRLLALPIMACLRELSVVGPWLAVRDPISAIPSEVRAGLRSLHLSAGAFGDLAPARVGELERLEALELLARRLSLPPLELPRLRRLTIGVEEFDDALVHALAHARLDALEELRLRLLWRVRGEDWVASLCEFVRVGPPQPIRRFCVTLDGNAIDSGFVELLFAAPWVRRLAHLELEGELADEDVSASFERHAAKLRGTSCRLHDLR